MSNKKFQIAVLVLLGLVVAIGAGIFFMQHNEQLQKKNELNRIEDKRTKRKAYLECLVLKNKKDPEIKNKSFHGYKCSEVGF